MGAPRKPSARVQKNAARGDDDKFKVNVANVIDELLLDEWDGALCYDERADCVLIRPNSPITKGAKDTRPYIDVDDTHIAEWFARKHDVNLSPTSAVLRGAVLSIAKRHSFDPVERYLTALVWDGAPRLDGMLANYFGAEDNELNAAFGAKWMLSAVARTYQPGCKADCLLVLVGGQGIRKSSALSVLAGQWFSDAVPGFDDQKKLGELLVGEWIVELAELAATKKSEVESIKAGLARQTDKYRPAFGTRKQEWPRRCVFAGTSNADTFLSDATGNRRFWTVRVHGTVERDGQRCIDVDGLSQDRGQLWAEAVHRYKNGETWWLSPELEQAAKEAQAEFVEVDAWQEPIESYLAEQRRLHAIPRVTLDQVLTGPMQLPVDRQDQRAQNRAARCLRMAGWERVQRRDGALLPDGTRDRRYAYEPKP